jgi:hypothetical protein
MQRVWLFTRWRCGEKPTRIARDAVDDSRCSAVFAVMRESMRRFAAILKKMLQLRRPEIFRAAQNVGADLF